MDLAHELDIGKMGDSFDDGFNPCFSGSCSRIVVNFGFSMDVIVVSILVLVDLAHESFASISVHPCNKFQSLF